MYDDPYISVWEMLTMLACFGAIAYVASLWAGG